MKWVQGAELHSVGVDMNHVGELTLLIPAMKMAWPAGR
jgi:hypothetical protein